jgi:phosphomannomutase
MLSQRKLFGTNGIRGVVNRELNPELATAIGCAIGTYFHCGNFLVGYDARTSSPMLAKAVISGLNAAGCNVLFAGIAPTPALQYAVKKPQIGRWGHYYSLSQPAGIQWDKGFVE